MTISKILTCLAPDGAEPELIKERARADLAKKGRGSSFPCSGPNPLWLRPLIEKKHLCTIYDISVHPFDVN